MDNEKFLKSFISDIEWDQLSTLANNELLLNAVQKVIMASVYYNGTLRKNITPDPMRNGALSLALSNETITNEALGQDIRAVAEGARMVQLGFDKLKTFKTVLEQPTGSGTGKNRAA